VWRQSKQNEFTKAQDMVHLIIIVYSVVNLAVIIIVVSNEMTVTFSERLLLLVNMFCIVFADLYFLYFTKFVQENSHLKLKLKLFEQQSNLQYEYYAAQEGKYNEAVNILHDVNKHLKMIEEIYEYNETDKAREYAKKIGQMLKPLILKEYTNHPILNILLNDKKKSAVLHNIEFELEVGNIELNFMEPVEITTVFGNLLDNAMEACEKAVNKKIIHMKLDTYNDFVVIQISNSTNGQTKWSDGKPISQKGDHHGIGLLNVENIIKKYNGSMILEEKNLVFKCSIIFND
jgi:signal transduction histidine kinase